MHCSNGLIRMKVVAFEGTSRSFTVWRKCVLSQLIMGFVHNTLTLYLFVLAFFIVLQLSSYLLILLLICPYLFIFVWPYNLTQCSA